MNPESIVFNCSYVLCVLDFVVTSHVCQYVYVCVSVCVCACVCVCASISWKLNYTFDQLSACLFLKWLNIKLLMFDLLLSFIIFNNELPIKLLLYMSFNLCFCICIMLTIKQCFLVKIE